MNVPRASTFYCIETAIYKILSRNRPTHVRTVEFYKPFYSVYFMCFAQDGFVLETNFILADSTDLPSILNVVFIRNAKGRSFYVCLNCICYVVSFSSYAHNLLSDFSKTLLS